jgi:hypothetical protein
MVVWITWTTLKCDHGKEERGLLWQKGMMRDEGEQRAQVERHIGTHGSSSSSHFKEVQNLPWFLQHLSL